MVVAEIKYETRKSKNYEKTINLYNSFIKKFEISHFDNRSIKGYGLIRSKLDERGNLIGSNDLIIASIVKANNGILVTHNTKEFSKVEGLIIEDWCK